MWTQSDQPPEAMVSKSSRVSSVVARILTLIFLAISLAIMKSNRLTWAANSNQVYLLEYNQVGTYKYMLASIIVGLAYNLLQTPFTAYYAIRGKRIINSTRFLKFDFYGDKVILCILAIGVGAAFGVTTELKKSADEAKGIDDTMRSKYDDFYNMAFVSAGFLFIGFVTSGISSIISSLALSKGE